MPHPFEKISRTAQEAENRKSERELTDEEAKRAEEKDREKEARYRRNIDD